MQTQDGRQIGCTTLVLCPGLEEDWNATPGLADAFEVGWAGSTFVVESAEASKVKLAGGVELDVPASRLSNGLGGGVGYGTVGPNTRKLLNSISTP